VNESPFIFAVSEFLSKGECEKLVALYATSEAEPSATAPEQVALRTSKTVLPPKEEIGWLRERISKLANVDISQLDHTKVTHYAKGEYFKRHIDTAIIGAGEAKMQHVVDIWSQQRQGNDAAVGAKWKTIADSPIFHAPDRFCSVFIYLNDVPEGGRTTFSNIDGFRAVDAFANACDLARSADRGVRNPTPAAGGAKSLSFQPRAGMAVVHFPTASAEYSCYPDPTTAHESEVAVACKFIVQQFIWSMPVEQAQLHIAAAHWFNNDERTGAAIIAVASALESSSVEDQD